MMNVSIQDFLFLILQIKPIMENIPFGLGATKKCQLDTGW